MSRIWRIVLGTLRDVVPVVAVVLLFQIFVVQQPVLRLFPLVEGALLVLTGLILLLYGLELALFPLGEALAYALAQRGSFIWLVVFAFLLGFGTTIAEPALTAVASEAADAAAAAGVIADISAAKSRYSFGLRLTVGLGVGAALVLGVTRIVMGWSLPMVVIGSYVAVTIMAFFAPAGDDRNRVRHRRRHDVRDHRTSRHGARCRARVVAARTKSDDRRVWNDRACVADAGVVRNGLRSAARMDLAADFARTLANTATDVVPVAAFMLLFYRVVLRQQLINQREILVGLGFVTVGLALLLLGVERALFPAGRMMVAQLAAATVSQAAPTVADWSNYWWIYAFAFCISFAAAIAEPALLAIALKVNELSGGAIKTWGLRLAAAIGVATGVALGCVQTVTGIPLHWCMAAGFAVIALQALTAPRAIVPLAFDSGGVSTTAVTVPIVTALGLGLAEFLPNRNPLLDGFGLIAFACLLPPISVLAYAQIVWLLEARSARRGSDGLETGGPDKED